LYGGVGKFKDSTGRLDPAVAGLDVSVAYGNLSIRNVMQRWKL
jgi:hypothetical protein